MDNLREQLESTIQVRIEGDAEFQSSLDGLSDEEKAQKLDEKKAEEFNKELASLKKGSDEFAKATELVNNYKTRAEKAEKALKEGSGSSTTSDLPSKDIIYLSKASIHEDDVDEVIDMARLKKVSVQEAHTFMKPILSQREEERKTALATQTRGGNRSGVQHTPAAVLEKANRGELPESDADIAALAEARMQARINAKK